MSSNLRYKLVLRPEFPNIDGVRSLNGLPEQPYVDTSGNIDMSGNYLLVKNIETGTENFTTNGELGVINVFNDSIANSGYCVNFRHAINGGNTRRYCSFNPRINDTNYIAGSITGNPAQVSYNTASDGRLKTDISNIFIRNEYVQSRSTADDKGDRPWLDTLEALEPVSFKFKDPLSGEVDISNTYLGFIAEQVRQVYPHAVTGISGEEIDGIPQYQQMDMSKLIPIIVGAIKELAIKIGA